MGRTRYKIVETQSPHFLTCTIVNWLPVFTRPVTVQIILDSFNYLQDTEDFKLYGYVILENHLHCIVQSPQLTQQMQRFKSWTARMIIQYLQEQGAKRLLAQLAFHKKPHKKDRQYQVWEEGMHPQWLQNNEMVIQKLEYIHHNPVKRGYVDIAEHWRYSSARNYAGQVALIEVFTSWVE